MASRFVNIEESAINALKTKAENGNSKKSTTSWLKVWQEWASYRNYDTQIENYPPEELDKTLENSFVMYIIDKYGGSCNFGIFFKNHS